MHVSMRERRLQHKLRLMGKGGTDLSSVQLQQSVHENSQILRGHGRLLGGLRGHVLAAREDHEHRQGAVMVQGQGDPHGSKEQACGIRIIMRLRRAAREDRPLMLRQLVHQLLMSGPESFRIGGVIFY